jgi:predicted transcriptional regulator
MDIPEIHQNTLSYTKIHYQVNTSKNLFRSYTKIHYQVNTSKNLFRCTHPEAENDGKMGTKRSLSAILGLALH